LFEVDAHSKTELFNELSQGVVINFSIVFLSYFVNLDLLMALLDFLAAAEPASRSGAN